MNEKQKDTNSSAQQKLKEETTQLLSVVEETEKELEKSYRILAEEPKENGENAPLDQKIQKEIDSLKDVYKRQVQKQAALPPQPVSVMSWKQSQLVPSVAYPPTVVSVKSAAYSSAYWYSKS